MLSVSIHFKKCSTLDPELNAIQEHNRPMFYIIDTKNRRQTINVVYCTIVGNDYVYHVQNVSEKCKRSRNSQEKAFKVPLTEGMNGVSGKELADRIAAFPPPAIGKGGDQWWILSSILELEKDGFVKPNTARALLSDVRMNSSKLLYEFEAKVSESTIVSPPNIRNETDVVSELAPIFESLEDLISGWDDTRLSNTINISNDAITRFEMEPMSTVETVGQLELDPMSTLETVDQLELYPMPTIETPAQMELNPTSTIENYTDLTAAWHAAFPGGWKDELIDKMPSILTDEWNDDVMFI